MDERPTAALRVAGSIPAKIKYLYDLLVVPDLAVCACECLNVPSSFFLVPSVGSFFLN